MPRHSAAADLETLRRGLAEVWSTQGRRFVTFEVEAPEAGSECWVQYLDGELNVRWPLDGEPGEVLASRGVALPRGAFAGWHVPRENAVFEVGDVAIDDVAQFIQALFARVLGAPPDRRLTSRVDSHG